MADIKTRDVTRGSIKTLDRAASSMHHLKEETIKGKYMEPGRGQDDYSGETYAENRVEQYAGDSAAYASEQYAGDSAAYASKAGIDMLLRSREHSNGYPAEIDYGNGPKPPAAPDAGIGSQEQIQRAFREQGVKDILERRNRSRMADREVARTAEENNFSGRIRNVSIGRRNRSQSRAIGRITKSSNTVQKKDELIQRTRKEHAIRRIVGRKETAGYPILSFFRPSGATGNNRRARNLSSFIKFMWENAKTAIMTLGAGGAAHAACYALMKLAMPPERWTPAGQDPERHYRRIFDFEKHHFSSKTIWRVFWGTNNYSMPDPVPKVGAKIEYWYGEEERKARKNNLAYTLKVYPQTVPREFKGLAHAELVMMFPERFYKEVTRFLREE